MDAIEDRIGEFSDVTSDAETLVQDFTLDREGDFDALKEVAERILEDLTCIESCDKIEDVEANYAEAVKKADALMVSFRALKGLKGDQKDMIDEAKSTLKSLIKELKLLEKDQ